MVKNMEKEYGLHQTEIFTMVNGSKAKFKVMGYINLQMVIFFSNFRSTI